MKKIIVSILFLFLLPIMVMADAGGPSLTMYDVRVKNPNGTYVEVWNAETGSMEKKLIPYDTIINDIFMEENINGELYGFYNDGSVKLSDCEVITKEFDFSKFNSTPGKLYVYKEGAYLYKGPSKVYGKVDNEIMIPVGTTIEYKYSDDLFAYVTYKDVSGWVYIYQRAMYEGSGPYKEGSSTARVENGELFVTKETKIHNDPVNSTELGKTIPANTKLEYKYIYNPYVFVNSYYVTYNGVSGWITNDNSNIAKKYNDAKIYTYNSSAKICKDTIENKCDLVTTIPEDTMLNIDYIIDNIDAWFYVTYKNKSGWVYYAAYDESPYRFSYFSENINLKTETKLYDKINGKELEKLEIGKYLIQDFYIYTDDDYNNRWLYVIDRNAWIKVTHEDFEYIMPNPEEIPTSEVINKLPVKTIVLYCVAGAFVLSLTTLVIIKLVNKKKND